MVSFISTLSLFILVLANGYFAYPAHDEKYSTSTFSPSFHGLNSKTTGSPRPLRGAAQDIEKNDYSPDFPTHPSPFDSMESRIPSTTERSPKENTSQKLRALNNKDHLESSTFTTERSYINKGEADNESGKNKLGAGHDNGHLQHTRAEEINQQPMQIESTTVFMPSFPSTSSPTASQFDLSTKKYPGSLRENYSNEKTRPNQRAPESSDDSWTTTYPTPQLDQNGLKGLTNVPNDVLNLDKSSSYVVTDMASTVRTTTMKKKDHEQDQGQDQDQDQDQGQEESTRKPPKKGSKSSKPAKEDSNY